MLANNDENSVVQSHMNDARNIVAAVYRSDQPAVRKPGPYPSSDRKLSYQQLIYEHSAFRQIIDTPSHEYISKTSGSWLTVGDHRSAIAAEVRLICEQQGLGVAMLVLHGQQVNTGHIPCDSTMSRGGNDDSTSVWS